MSDTMKVQSFETLLTWILNELEGNESIFGIPRRLFFTPQKESLYRTRGMFGHDLTTPIGPAAGPHTQLAQNIVCAWLSGGRFIELKTVQIMDELEIPRPCIDMEDEGYNVEWSQELKLDQSAWEYIKAWVLLHILQRVLGFEDLPLGTIFNMSVGYNLEGIQSLPMQRFMMRLEDASQEIAELQEILRRQFPQFADLQIPSRLTNSVTLSTMHGCPPDEIEAIARYMLEVRGLHTFVKLNPTLLGKEAVMEILHDHLGYHGIQIPDPVFEHDLQYSRAVALIRALQEVATERGLTFGAKLSNTLAMANYKDTLPGQEMYMSGRALYPVTINLFRKLIEELDGNLNVSYSAGADALNLSTILAAGAMPVTAASDLLKPGGYSRFRNWLEQLEADMEAQGASSLDELARERRANLASAAGEALRDPRYKKSYHPFGLPKVESGLDLFDCVAAPCVEQCAVCQDVPEYAWWIATGETDRALEVILHRNPLPGVTGYVCTHLCQTRCTRNNYDEPVAIRALKRFAFEHGRLGNWHTEEPGSQPAGLPGPKVAIVGSGPSGLAAAYFLALNGVQVTVFEAREVAGGMCAIAPHFRIPPSIVKADIDRILRLGVELKLSRRVTESPEDLLRDGFDAVYLACGLQKDATLSIPGIEGADGPIRGVFTALRFLEDVALGRPPELGSKVLVIGGGNTAMDAARTAQRLTGRPSIVVYRRTQAEMPAETEEQEWLLEEGNELLELVSPRRVILEKDRAVALECIRNELGAPGPDGRRRPVPVPGTEFQIRAGDDSEKNLSIILAIGQLPDITFLDGSQIRLGSTGTLAIDDKTGQVMPGVYAGGDVTRGPDIIIGACADGRRAAEAICGRLGIWFEPPAARMPDLSDGDIVAVKEVRTRRLEQHKPETLPVSERAGFACVEQTLDEEAARAEAARCLQCSTICDKCVEVCPNRANYSFTIEPGRWALPILACQNGNLAVVDEESFEIRQARQILHVDDFCNECGNCATFCVHQGKPYTDKPRLFLDEVDFLLEENNAYIIQDKTIRRRDAGREAKLALLEDGFRFTNGQVDLRFSVDFQVQEMALQNTFEGRLSMRQAAEMAVLMRGVMTSLAFLLTAP